MIFFDAQAVLFTTVVLSPFFIKVKTKNEAVLMCAEDPKTTQGKIEGQVRLKSLSWVGAIDFACMQIYDFFLQKTTLKTLSQWPHYIYVEQTCVTHPYPYD